MAMQRNRRLPVQEYVSGILEGNRIILSRAITLIESNLDSDAQLAREVLEKVMPATGNSIRIGITGVPGVGKSTFIESFGEQLTEEGCKLAVLAIDPSSPKTGGSIMGDKTRMEHLSCNPNAFIRPSPTGHTIGGVARKTRETMYLCEAAGFNTILIETVGVGQSETAVRGMVDFFLLLMLAGAGDELQGIKKGIMEMADAIAITKADGENMLKAASARIDYQNALHLFTQHPAHWNPQVVTCSALKSQNLDAIWQIIQDYRSLTISNGYFYALRQEQQLEWLNETLKDELIRKFQQHPVIREMMPEVSKQVAEGSMPAYQAAQWLLETYQKHS